MLCEGSCFKAALIELPGLREAGLHVLRDAAANVVDTASWVFPGLGHKRHRVPAVCTQVGRVTAPPEKQNPWYLAESGVSVFWCPGTESNRRHGDFQSPALPTELPGQRGAIKRISKGGVKRVLKKFFSLYGRLRARGGHSPRPGRIPRRRGTCPSRPGGTCDPRRSSCSGDAR